MSSKEHSERLGTALERMGLVQVINANFKENQVSILVRVLPGGEGRWIEVVGKLLKAEETENGSAHSWRTDISKPYFLKDKKLVYAWRVSIQSMSMSDSLDYIIKVIKGEAKPEFAKNELEEMPFTGMEGRMDRNKPSPGSKKGVYSAETDPRR